MDNIFPAVVQALAGDNFTVYAYMRDGTVRLYDMKPMIEKGGVFEPLRDETFSVSGSPFLMIRWHGTSPVIWIPPNVLTLTRSP